MPCRNQMAPEKTWDTAPDVQSDFPVCSTLSFGFDFFHCHPALVTGLSSNGMYDS